MTAKPATEKYTAGCGCSTTYLAGSETAAGIVERVRCATHAADDARFAAKPAIAGPAEWELILLASIGARP